MTPRMIAIWLQLRERKLAQWALAYTAGAFALVQGADLFAQRFGWPEAIERGLLIAAVIGFFVALVLAWYHGERGAQRVGGTELLILALLLLVGGAALWRMAPGGSDAADARAGAADASKASPDAVLAAIPRKSIAVLPFDSLSEDKTNGFFATGMQDEILTRLAGIGDLKVISRTSSSRYSSHPEDLRTVGQQLGVAAVLEGSVQRAGDRVHINLQLIDTQSDSHLWADTYDRELKDIFAVERDIAGKVAENLKAKLLPEEMARAGEVPTSDPAAHDLYLRGRVYFNRANDQFALTPTEMPQAIALFEQALALDPQFALAAADSASAHMYLYWFGPDRTAARLAAAKAAADRALALQPDLAEAHYAEGQYWYWGFHDYNQALQHYRIAQKAQPNNADVVVSIASIARRRAHYDEALAGYGEAAALSPRASLPHFLVGEVDLQLGRFAASEQAQLRAIEVAADPATARVRRGETLLNWKGDLKPLRAALGELTPGSDAWTGNVVWLYRLKWWSRDFAGAAAIAQSSSAENWAEAGNVVLPRRLFLARALAAAGDAARANAEYRAVREQLRTALATMPDHADLHVALGIAEAALGDRASAVAEGRAAVALMPATRDAFTGPVYPVKLAQICAAVGAKDEAIALIGQLLATPVGHVLTPALLRVDPLWDPLRNDARFKALEESSAKVF